VGDGSSVPEGRIEVAGEGGAEAVAVHFFDLGGLHWLLVEPRLPLAEPPYLLGSTAVGPLALVGVVDALTTPVADRRGSIVVVSISRASW
jgi:hypothetical protein